MRRLLALSAVLLLALAAFGCGADKEKTQGKSKGSTQASQKGGAATTSKPSEPPRCRRVAAPKPKPAQHLPKPTLRLDSGKAYKAVMVTSCGVFTITLDVKRAPKTTASFVSLARRGFYDDTIFHRIVPGFVIQGGDPQGTGRGGPGYSVVDAPPSDLKYTKGVVAMAKTEIEDPGTSGSQFYVVTADDAQLPADYALLGKVTGGQDVVDVISVAPTDQSNPDPAKQERPLNPVVLRRVTITESKK